MFLRIKYIDLFLPVILLDLEERRAAITFSAKWGHLRRNRLKLNEYANKRENVPTYNKQIKHFYQQCLKV